ncbi:MULTISPECIES: tail protein X [Pseudomonas]|uniref:Tail protein X n=1 Tax=Pseudomonas aphyarum TaxID=2942629 RepID=A0ABT5PVS8_9PSED|nr:tail protein X [Pseudomonas aphyarum]MDD0967240.1 tail protein X [Pseudomonas aphyarum]MDD1128009.1 tail protein X [Pseudomonas aphyarum]
MRKVRSVAGDSVNLLLYRETGHSDDSAEEALWTLNPTLAEHGPILPAGVWVTLPELDSRPAAIKPVLAWD